MLSYKFNIDGTAYLRKIFLQSIVFLHKAKKFIGGFIIPAITTQL